MRQNVGFKKKKGKNPFSSDDFVYSHIFLGCVYNYGLKPMVISLRGLWPRFYQRNKNTNPMNTF